MFRKDGKLYNHPVVQASRALSLLSSYRNGGGESYLRLASKHADRLLSYSVRSRNARYYPYGFDFPLHGDVNDTLRAPWYSAMAQGQVLSVFVRLYEITGDRKWRTSADETFSSFLNPQDAVEPWTVYVDNKRLLWFEEYPAELPDRAMNGHNFALFGVYDYWALTGDLRASQVFRGGLEATRQHAKEIREPGSTSWYCLRRDVQSSTYHGIHISQFYKLYTLTGQLDFARLGDVFQVDAPADYEAGVGYLASGPHIVVTRAEDGTATSTANVTTRRAERVKIDLRLWVKGSRGVWLRIDSGALTGKWVKEIPGVSYAIGVRDLASFVPARTGVFSAGAHVGYRRDSEGRLVAVRSLRLSRSSLAMISGRQTINGQSYVFVSNGALKGLAVRSKGVQLR